MSELGARWAAGIAVGLLGIYSGQKGRHSPQPKMPVTRESGVGAGPGTPPGGASDLHQALPPGEPPPHLLVAIGFLL